MHGGLCRNLHGHSYAMEVFLTGTTNNEGMVMDYFDLNEIVSPIVAELDHSFVVDRSDTGLLDFLVTHNLKHTVLDSPSTAENLAVYCLHNIMERLPKGYSLTKLAVSIHETEKTSAFVESPIS